MKLLHYIPNFTNAAGPLSLTVRKMLLSTSKVAEVVLLTSTKLPADMEEALLGQYGVRTIYINKVEGFNPIKLLSAFNEVRKVLNEEQPDIVHVHGAWNYTAALVEQVARKLHYITVVSTHRGVSSEIIGIDFWKQKLPRLLAYQIWMIRNSTSLIAINDTEKENIIALGLKKRIEVLPQIPKEGENLDMLREALMAMYRKAIDSFYYRYTTPAEQTFMEQLVAAAIVDEDVKIETPSTEGLSFRRLSFLLHDEDITELFLSGVHKMQVSMPPLLNVSATPRYKNRKAKQLGPLADVTLSKSIRLPEESLERTAVALIAKAKTLGIDRLTMRHKTELYRLFRYTDFDEEKVGKELKRLGLRKFTVKLQKYLDNLFHLKPGYHIY